MKVVTIPLPKGLSYLIKHAHDYEFLGPFTVQVTPWKANVEMTEFDAQWWSRETNKFSDCAYAHVRIGSKGVFLK